MSEANKLIAEELGKRALAEVQAQLAALRPEQLLTVDVSIREVVLVALRAVPRIQALQVEMAHRFEPTHPIALGTTEQSAWALGQAHCLYLASVRELHNSLETDPEFAAAVSAAARAEDTRRRVFTVFVTAYEQARSAIHYLRRREGDAAEIVPALTASSRKRTKNASPQSTLPDDADPDTARMALALMEELLEADTSEG